MVSVLLKENNMTSKEIKDKAKELCNESTCHHKCKDTKDCIVEEDAKEVIANSATTTEKQIEEMGMTPLDVLANDIYQHCPDLKDNYCGYTHCVACLANALYIAGYRKQSEVERLSHKCDDCAGCTQWKCDCANIELDVAREIFEGIDGITDLFAKGLISELEMYDMFSNFKNKYPESKDSK